MKKLFVTRSSSTYKPLLLTDASQWAAIEAKLNKASMDDADLTSCTFEFQEVDKKTKHTPDVCSVYISGALAFKKEFKEALFPNAATQLEFLPFTVLGKPWLLLNCLQAASSIDATASKVMRGLNGEICYVMKIRVTDSLVQGWDVFTLDDSNRAQLFVTNAFLERFKKLGLKGIEFQEIGEAV